ADEIKNQTNIAGPPGERAECEVRLLFSRGDGFGCFCPLDSLQARCLASKPTQVIQLRATDAALAPHLNRTDGRRVERDHALNSNSKTHAPHRETRAGRFPTLLNHHALKRLDAFFLALAFLQTDVDANGVARPQVRQILAHLRFLKFFNY